MTDTDPDAFQAATDRWLAARSPTTTALAADGKRLRGANRQSDAEYQTVSLVSHHDKQPVANRVFTEKGGEVAAVHALLEETDISGSVITLDALHTTRATAAAILHRHHAHYLLSVKGNASETYAALDTIDWDQDATASFCEQRSKGHGRNCIEQRHIQTMESVPGMLNYPQVKQVFRIIRHRHTVKTWNRFQRSGLRHHLVVPRECGRTAAAGAQSRPLDHRERQPPLPRYHLR